MITKQLMHDIITFCNNYIDNDNILISVTKYPTFLSVDLTVWTLTNKKNIDTSIGKIPKYINNEEDFIEFKQEVLEQLPKLLERLK